MKLKPASGLLRCVRFAKGVAVPDLDGGKPLVVGGDPKGYRGLAQCISNRVRGWQFPPSGDTTTVNVPFVFAAQ